MAGLAAGWGGRGEYSRAADTFGGLKKGLELATFRPEASDAGVAVGPNPPAALERETVPMISTAMAVQINAQINRELYSAYLYLGLSAEADAANLKGTAAWFMAKHGEEMVHALKMVRYLLDQGATMSLGAIAQPPAGSGQIVEMFERTLAHERSVTGAINDLVDHALGEKDHATNIFLHWFITEQIEEEATVNDILGRLRLFGDKGEGLLMIDNELAAAAKLVGKSAAAGSAAAAA